MQRQSPSLITTEPEDQAQKCLRDLLSLQALASLWNGRPPPEILKLALQAIPNLIALDFLLVRVSQAPGELEPLEAYRATGLSAAEVRAVREAVVPHLAKSGRLKLTVPLDRPDGALQVVGIPLGFYGGTGSIIFGAERSEFPNQIESTLLRTAASLLTTSLDAARLLEQAQSARIRAGFLSEASSLLAASLDGEAVLPALAELAVSGFAEGCLIEITAGSNPLELKTAALAHRRPERTARLRAFRDHHQPERHTCHGLARVLWSRGSELLSDLEPLKTRTQCPLAAEAEGLLALGCRSRMIVPIQARGETLGALVFLSGQKSFTSLDLETAEDLGRRVGAALDNGRLYHAIRLADRRKDEFLAMLSHELRNPLTPLRTALEILRLEGSRDSIRHKSCEIMERQVRNLTFLVNDLLDISRITRGKIHLRDERVDLSVVVGGALEAVRPLLSERGHRLTTQLPVDPVLLRGDAVRLEQALANLLQNAGKFTKEGGHVDLECHREGTDVVLIVTDDGIGIEPGLLPHIFDLYFQVDSDGRPGQGGLGIGLSLVRQLIELHGGTVTASSSGAGQGAQFIIRLPAAPDQETEPLEKNPRLKHEERSRRILVVDDNVDAAETLALLLRFQGHEVHLAHSGEDALRAVDRHQPEVLFLDIGLPDLDGYEVARRLRRASEAGALLIVAVTGWGQEEDRRRSQDAGIDYHLVKPVDPALLSELLSGRG